MFRLRQVAVSICQKLRHSRLAKVDLNSASTAAQDILVQAIKARADTNQTTTLRQLHKITTLSQRQALNAINKLSENQMVAIDHDINDELESTITLMGAKRSSGHAADRGTAE
ncbi:hypothetical protein FGU71_12945 [Erythrobacter insulae]|uniref:MarR family transcriptional regulator n=1 Tax=Erythrobacter insulae TaxID=2584124 RepID=A0A547P6Z7_9SPHN|nr:hypothetical protein [Erythrobacter insulae]TRD09909.1 hypothetical protein FGU71_12945 [Erythrobacter insulae]